MASSQTIHDSMIKTIESVNKTADTTKGPVYDLLLRPVPDEIALPSQEVEDLKTLYSPLIATNPDNTAAIDTLGRAFRVPKPVGKRARTTLVFWFTSVPTQDITIPSGTAVSTSDRGIIYTTTSDIQGINAQTAYNYYNASTGRYEIYTDAVATQDGQDFEVPAYRLTALLSRLSNISGVYNPVPGTGGISAGGDQTYIERIQSKFVGRDSSSFASYELAALELYPDSVLNFIPSSDRSGFRRFVRSDGFDVVVYSALPGTQEDVFVANNTSVFPVSKQPLLQVLSVFVNGVQITDYAVVKNADPSVSDSARAGDGVRITRALKTSDTVRIRYTYCMYCYDLQYQVFNSNTDDFFGHDALVRLATPCQLSISLSIQTSSSNSDFQNSVTDFITGYVNGLGFVPSTSSTEMLEAIYAAYTEIRSITVREFRRVSNSNSGMEIVEFLAYEKPELLSTNLQISVVG